MVASGSLEQRLVEIGQLDPVAYLVLGHLPIVRGGAVNTALAHGLRQAGVRDVDADGQQLALACGGAGMLVEVRARRR